MKTIFITLAGLFSIISANAQKLKEAEIPAPVKESFAKEFSGVKANEWQKEGNTYEAEFDLKKTETSATFSADGKLLETEQEIAVTTLPKAASDYVTKNYPGHKLSEASRITESGTNKVFYEAEVKKGKEGTDLIFDDTGNFIRKEEAKQEDKD
ncbi:MAG: hypothetical protein K0S33_3053 [Bacteroidetes bacterium]|jgi:hypothetical protein|nr:hypothetical protein [Bacteroidota bacterium]